MLDTYSNDGELWRTTLDISKGGYRDVHIEADSVIYCDIPYKGTGGYIDRRVGGDGFDYEAFYDWCCAQTVPVYISEYNMPSDRFIAVWERKKVVTICATYNRKYAMERLYTVRK